MIARVDTSIASVDRPTLRVANNSKRTNILTYHVSSLLREDDKKPHSPSPLKERSPDELGNAATRETDPLKI